MYECIQVKVNEYSGNTGSEEQLTNGIQGDLNNFLPQQKERVDLLKALETFSKEAMLGINSAPDLAHFTSLGPAAEPMAWENFSTRSLSTDSGLEANLSARATGSAGALESLRARLAHVTGDRWLGPFVEQAHWSLHSTRNISAHALIDRKAI